MSSLTRIAVDRPVTTLMASVMIIILGGVALNGLTVDLMPDMSYPTVSVNTVYRGAGPEEVETLITRPLEQVQKCLAELSAEEQRKVLSSNAARVYRIPLS